MQKPILIVDDSPTVRQQVGLALRQAGYDVVEATDGMEGLAKLDGVAMVICDVNMPRMNGLEMLETVQKQGRHAGLKILMLTTEGQPELMDRAKRAGALGWIIKPFKAHLLVAAVKKLLA